MTTSTKSRRSVSAFCMVGLITLMAAPATFAQSGQERIPGRIDFAAADLPTAKVELPLTNGVFGDLFGLGDAALAGVTSALSDSDNHREASEAMMFAAKQVNEFRTAIPLAKEVIREVRVRVYEDGLDFSDLTSRFKDQLTDADWQPVARIQDNNTSVHISLLRRDGALRGVFVLMAEKDATVLANLVCDASPEKIEQLANVITKIGLDTGLRQELQQFAERMK